VKRNYPVRKPKNKDYHLWYLWKLEELQNPHGSVSDYADKWEAWKKEHKAEAPDNKTKE